MIATTTTYQVMNATVAPLLVPVIIDVLGIALLLGLAIRAMKSKDLV